LKRRVVLASGHGAGCYAGPAWFKSLIEQAKSAYPGCQMDAVLDCGDAAGTALAALLMGLKRVGFSGCCTAQARLGEIARALGAAVESGGGEDALDLRDGKNAAARCEAYLAGGRLA